MWNKKFIILFCVFFGSPGFAVESQTVRPEIYKEIAGELIIRHITPGYREFQEQTSKLELLTQAFCQNRPTARLQTLQDQWRQTAKSWQKVQFIQFGPTESFHRGQRVFFWPDKNNARERQLRQTLALKKPQLLEPKALEFASVAIQGLPALEILLFRSNPPLIAEPSPSNTSNYPCQYLKAVATNLNEIAAELRDEWSEPNRFGTKLKNAGARGNEYENHQLVVSLIFNHLHTHLMALAELKLGFPLAESPESAKPGRLEGYWSKSSLAFMKVNLIQSQNIFLTTFAPRLVALGRSKNSNRVEQKFTACLAIIEQINDPIENTLNQKETWEKAQKLRQAVLDLAQLSETDVGNPLSLQLGFNGLDGD